MSSLPLSSVAVTTMVIGEPVVAYTIGVLLAVTIPVELPMAKLTAYVPPAET